MSSSLKQGLTSNSNLITSPTHERFDLKKKYRKRKNLLNRYGSSKRRKLATSSSRKQALPNEQIARSNSCATERHSQSNAALNSGLNSDLQSSQCMLAHDGNHRNTVENKQMKHADLDLCTNLDVNNRVMGCSQAAQLDTEEVLCSSTVLSSTKSLEPAAKSACDKMQSTSEKRVLRPRRVHNKEIKENVPPPADSPLIVGRRVEVFWPLDATWYCGLISAYDNVRKKHKVSYDDGEEEWLYLAREKFKYETPSKSESVQSGGKAKDSEIVKDGNEGKDGFSLLGLPPSSPQEDLNNSGTRNGSPMPMYRSIRKSTASSAKIISPQVVSTASKVSLPSEGGFDAKQTGLNTLKDTKVFIRRHKGHSVGLERGKTEVDGFVKGEGSSVHERRQRHGLESRLRVDNLNKRDTAKRLKGSKGQHLQEIQKSKKKGKHSYKNAQCKGQSGHSCSAAPQNTEKSDGCAPEDGDVAAVIQEVQPKLINARKRKQQLSNHESGIAEISKGADHVLKSLNAGLAVHSSSEEVHKGTRRKHKVKSLAQTAFAAEVVKGVGFTARDKLPSGDGETRFVYFDNLPPGRSRLNSNSDGLELGKLERRQSNQGRRYTGGYIRGRGLLRRIRDRRTLHGSAPSSKHQDSHVATNENDVLLKSSCDQVLHFKNSTSLPHSSIDTASMNCMSMLSPHTASLSSGTGVTKRSASEGNFSHCIRQHCSKVDAGLEGNGRLNPQKAFHSTIYFPRPNVVSSLFTWQLFNMLEAIELCGGKGFGGRFQWKGSTQDLVDIVLLFISVVRSIQFTNQKCVQCWQGRVAHDLWSVLSRKEQWSRNLPASLSPQADNLLMQHVRQLISAHCIVNMTSREMLNIFSSYILKPYIVAILCEKGAQLRVVVQQYLLASCPLQDGICFKRQFVRIMKLSSHAGAEVDFDSCLMYLPVAYNQCTGVHKIFANWISSVASVGYAWLPIPNPSFKLCRNQGLQFITASVVSQNRKSIFGHSTLYLEQNSGRWHLGDIVLPREVVDLLFHGRFSCFHEFRRQMNFYTGLCFDSVLQKWLESQGSKSIASEYFPKKLHITANLNAKKEVASDSCDWELESGKSTKNDSSYWMGMDFAYWTGLEAPAEANLCNQISQERNTFVVVKEEYMPLGGATQFDKDTTSNTFMGSSPISSSHDFAYSASGSSSCSSEEFSTKWKTTKVADISFRPHDTVEPKGPCMESCHTTSRKQLLKKQAVSKRRPRGFEEKNSDMLQVNLSCCANILLSNETRSWREFGVRVELQCRKSEWMVVVQLEGASYSHKVVESAITSRVNRFTHGIMWKGGDGWVLEFCDRTQWILFKRMHEECGHRNARAAFVKQIPIPVVKQIEVSSEDRPYDTSLFGEKWPGEVENALDCTKRVYDMDSEDERWLAQRSQRAQEKISMDSFERIIDKLERITYLRQGEMVASDEVIELCESIASEDAMLSIHLYWSEKRKRKDNALIRYFESPLPKKYERQLDNWKQRMEEFECRFPNVSKEELQRQFPQPLLFAFCWPSRGLDADNVSKRLQRQRSQQKHLNALKYMRTSSFDTSEELQRGSLLRSHRGHNSDWYQATQRRDYWQRIIERDGFSEHLVAGFKVGNADHSSLYEVQTTAAALRQSAQMYMLRFDSALQRAVSSIMDFEAIYIAELTLMSESTTASYDHLLDLRKRIRRVMNQFSSLAGKDGFLEGDLGLEDGTDDAGEHEEDDPSWTVGMHEDGFGNSAFSLKEEGTFLSISERAHLEEWMRSTLRQRAC